MLSQLSKSPRSFLLLVLTCTLGLAYAGASQAQQTPAYVGSQECRDCHLNEALEWDQSHHALAWTEATLDTVVADFSDVEFTHDGVTSRFFKKNGRFMIETQGPDGQTHVYPVAGVAGITPLQQFLIETEPGKLQSFDVTWDDVKKQWYHLYPDQDLPVGDGLHWTGPYKNWNARCAECHATDFDKNYDPRSGTYSSTQSEIGVGCEACHGPGEVHLAWAKDSAEGKETDMSRWISLTNTGFSMDFNAGAETEIQQCASCHSRREPFEGGNPLPGTPFHDTYRLSNLRSGLYHADGQILDEVYVYGSFLQSKMYDKGVACTNCHNAHTGEPKIEGNGLCTQCHSDGGNPDFPSLTLKSYDDPAHHFHAEGGQGAECKSCHMIERDYMGIDGRRDHSFRIPRPDLSVKTGSPNACNDCHSDQSFDWAAAQVETWYPDSPNRGPHFSQVLAAGRTSPAGQVDNLIGIAMHDALPGIVRATALDMLAQLATPAIADQTAPALEDSDPLVRVAAIAAQRGGGPREAIGRITQMFDDPSRAVRIAAARAFLGTQVLHMPKRIEDARNAAMREWQSTLQAKADFPEAQLVLAGIGLTTRRFDAALAAFSEAVDMDPQLEQAWTMIVRINSALGNQQAAIDAITAAVKANPDSVDLSLMKVQMGQ